MRPKGLNIEAGGRERGGGGCWEGQQVPHQPGALGERCELPSSVWGGAPTTQKVSTISRMASPDSIKLLIVDH